MLEYAKLTFFIFIANNSGVFNRSGRLCEWKMSKKIEMACKNFVY